MAKITRTVSINAPVEKTFDYMGMPTNLLEIWPSMVEIKNLKPLPTGGYNYDWVYKMGGMHFEGASETTEYFKNQRVVVKNTKGIPSTFVWKYDSEDGKTMLSLEVEYTIPIPLLGKLAEALIVKQNEREADTMLANLKDRMEV